LVDEELGGRHARWRVAALDAADAFLEQAQAFIELGERAEFDFDGLGPVAEGVEEFGLHVAGGFDHLVKACVDVGAEFGEVLFCGEAVLVGHA
jgi:hypothetical protein